MLPSHVIIFISLFILDSEANDDGFTVLFERKFDTQDSKDSVIALGAMNMNFSYGNME